MDPTMRAARFLVSPVLSLSPLCTTGTTSAKLGASMVLMKVVDSRVSRQARVEALGSAMAARSAGTRAAISGLRMTLPTWQDTGFNRVGEQVMFRTLRCGVCKMPVLMLDAFTLHSCSKVNSLDHLDPLFALSDCESVWAVPFEQQ